MLTILRDWGTYDSAMIIWLFPILGSFERGLIS